MIKIGKDKTKENRKRYNYLTMMVMENYDGKPIKNFCVPKWVMKLSMVVGIAIFLICTYFVSGYFSLHYIAEENKELQKINVSQEDQIKELKSLAGDMEKKLEALIEIDKEVRKKVGLVEEDKVSMVSRGLDRYQCMTMELSDRSIRLASNQMIPYSDSSKVLSSGEDDRIVASIRAEKIQGDELIMELPVPEGEENALDELKTQLSQMDDSLTKQSEKMDKLKLDVENHLAFQNSMPNAWPVNGKITSNFGWRQNPFSKSGNEFHAGVDIAAPHGSPIMAAGDGVVIFSGPNGSWGRLVLISHGFGYVSQYAHNSSLIVKKGQKVERGQIIARLGSSGRATGAHLHFGIAKYGKWIDPLEVLK